MTDPTCRAMTTMPPSFDPDKPVPSPDTFARLPGRLVVISGASGVGKTTLVRTLLERATDLKLRLSISATTRPPRPDEMDGRDYYFLSRSTFEAAREKGAFLEWAEVHGKLYGTPAVPVAEMLADGFCVLLVIDVQGGRQVKERVPNALLVWVEPPSLESLETRLRGRSSEDEATIRTRLDNARRETEAARALYPREFSIRNDDDQVDAAARALAEFLRRHGCTRG